jgi:hypothetical protein
MNSDTGEILMRARLPIATAPPPSRSAKVSGAQRWQIPFSGGLVGRQRIHNSAECSPGGPKPHRQSRAVSGTGQQGWGDLKDRSRFDERLLGIQFSRQSGFWSEVRLTGQGLRKFGQIYLAGAGSNSDLVPLIRRSTLYGTRHVSVDQ